MTPQTNQESSYCIFFDNKTTTHFIVAEIHYIHGDIGSQTLTISLDPGKTDPIYLPTSVIPIDLIFYTKAEVLLLQEHLSFAENRTYEIKERLGYPYIYAYPSSYKFHLL